MQQFSHIKHDQLNMVDVGDKKIQQRYAAAQGIIYLSNDAIDLISNNQINKGNVLATAQIAGIQAAKQTAMLIPLCHNLILNKIEINFEFIEQGIIAKSIVKSDGRTGVEMEALTAVSVALLTIYDMCKAVDKNMNIGNIKLTKKIKYDQYR